MGKPTIYIGENKGTDQLRSNCEADQRLCFRYSDSKIPLPLKSDCWFSHEAAHLCQLFPTGWPTECLTCHFKNRGGGKQITNQDPVVQSIVSLTISLRHKFVKQISAKVTNTLLFFVEKM